MASSAAATVDQYLAALPADRRAAIAAVRDVVRAYLPQGIAEGMLWGMINYYIPLSTYPDTYNGQPLCFAGLASQKSYMSLYLMGVYADPKLRAWFEKAFRAAGKKLDMGKSCVHFRTVDDLPLPVIGEAIAKVGMTEFIAQYEAIRATTAAGRKKAKKAAAGKAKPAAKAKAKAKAKPAKRMR